MGDEDVENYVDSIVDRKLKKLGYKAESNSNDGNSGEIVPPQIKEFTNAIKMVKELGEVSRGDLDRIVSDGIKQKMAENIVPVLFNTPQKSSFSDSGFAQSLGRGLGEKLGENANAIIDTLTKNFGKEGAEKVLDKVLGGGPEKQTKKNDDIDVIKSLDVDNPNHLHYYMSIRGLGQESVDIAKKSLLAEKANLASGIGSALGSESITSKAEQVESAIEKALIEQNTYLQQMANRQNQSDEIIKFLVEKIEKIEGASHAPAMDMSMDMSMSNDGINSPEDKTIIDSVASKWEKDIEKNKQMIKEKEERELKDKQEKNLKSEKEFAVVGRIKGSPVFEMEDINYAESKY